jgi:hypothetical protein
MTLPVRPDVDKYTTHNTQKPNRHNEETRTRQ